LVWIGTQFFEEECRPHPSKALIEVRIVPYLRTAHNPQVDVTLSQPNFFEHTSILMIIKVVGQL
jgi:hypothetical protein